MTATFRITRWRRAAQLLFLSFYLGLPVAGASVVSGTLVALRIGPVDLVEPAAAVSVFIAARTAGWALLLGVAPVVLLALVVGPVYCSWVCPFGLLSEAIDRVRRRPRWTGRPWVAARRWRLASFTLLALGSATLGLPLAAILAPPRLVSALPLEARVAAGLPAVTAGLLVAAVLIELLAPRRLLCRALCPAGGVAAFLRTPVTLRPVLDRSRCRCREEAPCLQACPWGIDPREMEARDGCTTCLACVERCPSGALGVGWTRTRRAAERSG